MKVFDPRRLWTVGVLLLISTLAVNGATSKDEAVVRDVSFNANGNSLEVKIAANDSTPYTYFNLDHPHRLVVDFHGLQNGIGFREKSLDVAGVERVRTSLYKDDTRQATRIVFDLAENTPYTVSGKGSGAVRILFGPAAESSAVKAVDGKSGPRTKVPMSVTAEPMIPAAEGPMPGPAKASLVAALTSLKPAMEAGPVMSPVAMQVQSPVVQAALTDRAIAAAIDPVQTALSALQAVPAGTPQTPGQPQYTGEIVSFDLKDVDLKDFFRLIADISGLNIVLDPAVNGTISALVLTNVPWDQALDIVLKNHQLGSQLEGNVLRIATNSTLQAEETARKALRDAQELSADLSTRSYLLNYTKADAVSSTLKSLLTQRGTIIQDARQNAIIVSDIPAQFEKIDQMVKFLDKPAQQVEIEARLLSANKSFSRELGNQLGFVFGNNSRNVLTGAPAAGVSPFTRTPAPNVTSSGGSGIPLAANFPAAASSGLSFLLGAGADVLLDEIITAAEARGTAKLISRPKVTTQNHQPATISQGTKIPVQTNQNNTISVQFLDFSLKLTVTPQITDVGTILLNVQIENSQPDFARAVNGIPSVATQNAMTQVLISDGGTAVIGGILLDTDSYNVRQVPGLGSMPVVGHLFKNTQVIKSTSELLFFITSRIKPSDTLNMTAPSTPPGR